MGRPKLSLPFGSETMLLRVVRILLDVVSPVVVVAADDQELPPLPNDVLVARDETENLGPLEGLAVGLSALESHVEAAYVSSCDVPLLQPAFVCRMIEELGSYDLAVPRDGRYHHPLAGVYRTSLTEAARALLAAGQNRPRFLIDQSRSNIVNAETLRTVDPQLDSLRNINTPDDYQAALKDAGLSE